MDKKIMYWLVWATKVALLAFIVLPVVMWGADFMYETLHGHQVDAQTRSMARFGVAIMIGVMAGRWLYGHKDAIDAYYDNYYK